jgi:hypothetical protein
MAQKASPGKSAGPKGKLPLPFGSGNKGGKLPVKKGNKGQGKKKY